MVPMKFTQRAHIVINYANEEAVRLNHSQIDTEHLLLGLIYEGHNIAVSILQELGVSLERLETEVRGMIKAGETPAPRGKPLTFTSAANKVLQHATEESHRLQFDHVGTRLKVLMPCTLCLVSFLMPLWLNSIYDQASTSLIQWNADDTDVLDAGYPIPDYRASSIEYREHPYHLMPVSV